MFIGSASHLKDWIGDFTSSVEQTTYFTETRPADLDLSKECIQAAHIPMRRQSGFTSSSDQNLFSYSNQRIMYGPLKTMCSELVVDLDGTYYCSNKTSLIPFDSENDALWGCSKMVIKNKKLACVY